MVLEAVKVQSPFLVNHAVPLDVAMHIVYILEKGHKAVKQEMLRKLADVKTKAKEFRSLEEAVKNSMREQVRSVLTAKSTVLFEHLVKKSGIVDVEFFEKFRNGFPLTGHRIRETVIGKCKTSDLDDEAMSELRKVTADEVAAGYLDGPYSVEEAVKRAGPHTTFARRFRHPIDDFSVSRTNMCLTTVEKAKVDSLDLYLSKARFLLEASRSAVDHGYVDLPDGSRRTVVVHDDWLEDGALDVEGRCLDLSNAYKQFPVSPANREHTAIAVPKGPGMAPEIYFTQVLPFGAAASVYYFLRFSEMLKVVLLHSLGIICSCYFDDFPCVSYRPLSGVTQFAMESVLDTLGFEYSRKERKRLRFASEFSMQGVVVTFPRGKTPCIELSNTVDRKEEVQAFVDKVKSSNSLAQPVEASLMGRIGFLTSQVWGRVGQVLFSELRTRASGSDQDASITAGLRDALDAAVILLSSPPRQVCMSPSRKSIWMFTDAACEQDEAGSLVCSIGGVLLDNGGWASRVFSCRVPMEVTRLWGGSGQSITFAESLAALVGKMLWRRLIAGSYLVIGLDNIGAQQTLARYSSSSYLLKMVIRGHIIEDASSRLRSWVPSESNVADAPSRLDCEELLRKGAVEDDVDKSVWSEVIRYLSLTLA